MNRDEALEILGLSDDMAENIKKSYLRLSVCGNRITRTLLSLAPVAHVLLFLVKLKTLLHVNCMIIRTSQLARRFLIVAHWTLSF